MFITRGITVQKTRFGYVINSLSPEFAMEAVTETSHDNPYDVLKAELVKCSAASEQRKLQLISGEELGNHKTTQLLSNYLQHFSRFYLRIVLQCLPPNVRF